MGSREDAEEIAQEAFLKAYVNLGRFEERSRFSTWLTRIAVNTALMELRRRREDEAEEFRVCPPQIADWWPNPESFTAAWSCGRSWPGR